MQQPVRTTVVSHSDRQLLIRRTNKELLSKNTMTNNSPSVETAETINSSIQLYKAIRILPCMNRATVASIQRMLVCGVPAELRPTCTGYSACYSLPWPLPSVVLKSRAKVRSLLRHYGDYLIITTHDWAIFSMRRDVLWAVWRVPLSTKLSRLLSRKHRMPMGYQR